MTNGGSISLSTREPPAPERADFALYIDFQKGTGSPQRIFQAADAMIRALQQLDHVLCNAIDGEIQPVMVLEEVEAGSLRIWLANILDAIDDQALKELDWKPAIGKYLVRAKYVVIEWANSGEAARLPNLRKRIQQIATETDVRHIPAYSEPATADLVGALGQIEKAKRYLTTGDRITYIAPDEGEQEFDLSVSWSPDAIAAMATAETVRFPAAPMILTVKRPDYLGTSKWDFRFGRRTIGAKIEDMDWLGAFHRREKDVRPGDALRCLVAIEHSYGYDRELVAEKYTVERVLEVLEAHTPMDDLFIDDDSPFFN